MFLLLKYTLLYTVVLMMVALGGMFSERSGIINIALEGIMVIGGLMGVIAIQMMPAGASAFSIVLVSVLAAGIAGMLYAGAVGVRFDQSERGSDHRRHGAQPAGHRAGDGHRQGREPLRLRQAGLQQPRVRL